MNRALLATQHDQLRSIMDRCEQLADDVDSGRAAPELLLREILQLRVAFDQHNNSEEQQLAPILRETGSLGDARIEHIVTAHVDEHAAMRKRFTAGPTSELRDTLAMLRDHLDTEDRYLLGTRIVMEDRNAGV